MLEQTGDLWAARQPGDYVVITINGATRRDGALVMGRGIAYEATQKYPWLQANWGKVIQTAGLKVFLNVETNLIAFPVKYHFRDRADINLILRSVLQLKAFEPVLNDGGRILMPRPGCGNGRLDWAEVEPLLRHYLTSDRFVVFHKPARQMEGFR